jgi:hypothetical protein
MTPTVSWALRAVAVAAAAIVLAVVTNVLAGPYFERSFLEEASPLASAGDPPAAAAPTQATASTPEAATPATDATMEPGAMTAGILLTGEIRDGEPGHNGEGQAQILRDESGVLFLRLENFSVTNGPDLFVVLSPDDGGYADGSLNLGGLKATDGSINYEIPAGTDLAQFKSAVIWCRSFDVTFAVATLMEVT